MPAPWRPPSPRMSAQREDWNHAPSPIRSPPRRPGQLMASTDGGVKFYDRSPSHRPTQPSPPTLVGRAANITDLPPATPPPPPLPSIARHEGQPGHLLPPLTSDDRRPSPPRATSPRSHRVQDWTAPMVGRQHLDFDNISGSSLQTARERYRKAEAERDLLRAEHEALQAQLRETRRLLGQKDVLAAKGARVSSGKERVTRDRGDQKLCRIFTNKPEHAQVKREPVLMEGEEELYKIHTKMCEVEAKLAALATSIGKSTGYRVAKAGTQTRLTTNDKVEVHQQLVADDELRQEELLLAEWHSLREEYDKEQKVLDEKEFPPEHDREPGRVSVIGSKLFSWMGLAVLAIIGAFVYMMIEDEDTAQLVSLWYACIMTVAVVFLLGRSRAVPMPLLLTMAAVGATAAFVMITIREEVHLGTPILLAAALIVVAAFSLQTYPLIEMVRVDEDLRDPVFRALVHGQLKDLQQIASATPWRVRRRDGMTATVLHGSLIRTSSTVIHASISDWLMTFLPYMTLDEYKGTLFEGMGCVHYPILHRNKPLIQRITTLAPHSLKSRAVGLFFKDRETGLYYGEWPLMFAASSNQPDVVAYFLQVAAERIGWPEKDHLNIRDTDGNTLLHICVHHNLPQMYDYIAYLCDVYGPEFLKEGADKAFNNDDFTPFTLAANLGHKEIFEHLLERATSEEWRLGPCRCRKMWLDELDPGSGQPKFSKGVLQLLVDNEHADLLILPAVKELLMVKWQTFAERLWMYNFSMLLVYLLAFSVVVFYGPLARSQSEIQGNTCGGGGGWLDFGDGSEDAWWWSSWWCELGAFPLRRICELVVVAGAFYKLLIELRLMFTLPPHLYFGRKGSMLMEQIVTYGYCISILSAMVWRGFEEMHMEDLSLAAAALFLWALVLHELLGFRGTGPFVVMIWKMLGSDLVRFLIIFAAFLLGFTQALYLLVSKYGAQYFFQRLLGCFVALLGQADISSLIFQEDSSPFPLISTSLLLIYVLMVSILLLNLLIAMMTTTYSKVYDESDKVWNLEWARLIISIESKLSEDQRMQKEYKYWGEVDTLAGKKRYFLLPGLREEDLVSYRRVPPSWPPNAPHSIIHPSGTFASKETA